MSINTLYEPKSYDKATEFECWNQVMQGELSTLERMGTWQLVDAPPNIKPIWCRWIYKVKFHAYGSVERFKS